MTNIDFAAPAELYLGRDRQAAFAQGPRVFRTTAQAIRFACEEVAPVHLRGARLKTGGRQFSGRAFRDLFFRRDFPLPRRSELPA